MAISVQNNMMAMFTSRSVGITTGKIAKSTEKLSSGYKINRAADNAAGLAISEKMRRQVRGLTQGTENAQEGISLCQTADGALAEVSSMLHRMTELSIQAANDPLTDGDRAVIQQEISAIKAEISRVGNTTTYNERPLFGDIIGEPVYKDVNLVQSPAAGTGHLTESYLGRDGLYHPSASLDFSNVSYGKVELLNGKSFNFTCSQSCPEAFKFTFDNSIPYSSSTASNLTGQVQHNYVIGTSDIHDGTALVKALYDHVKNNMPNSYVPGPGGDLLVSHSNMMSKAGDDKLIIYSTTGYGTEAEAKAAFAGSTSIYGAVNSSDLTTITYREEERDLWIQAGAESGSGLYLTIPRMNAEVIGVGDLDVSTTEGAKDGIDKIKNALKVVSKARADIGAQQNRLEHTVNNNGATVENTQAAESRIRDTDMAKEMVNLSLKNIIQQAGMNMMAQANQIPEGVLSLLS